MPRTRPLKAALLVLALAGLLFASFLYGVRSMLEHTRPSKLALYVLEAGSAFSAGPEPQRAGAWNRVRTRGGERALSVEQSEAAGQLAALPYLQGYKAAPSTTNVSIHDEGKAYDGLTFVVSGHGPAASLIDMKGSVLHQWSKEFGAVWPNRPDDSSVQAVYKTYWRRAHLMGDGSVLAIFMDLGLIKLDKDSNLLWSYQGRPHHDLFVDEAGGGNIYVLTREVRPRTGLRLAGWTEATPVLEDFVTVLSPQGKELRRVSLVDCILNSDFASLLEHTKGRYDLLHANTVRPLAVDGHPVFKRGQLLVSFREIHTIAAVDLEQQKLTWIATGMWRFQHDPALLANGNVLLFDNRGNAGKSKAVEFDPVTQRVAWSYRGQPPESFHSEEAGSIQRLANGNTLINESQNGRGFEVTPAGEIVWEFYNPNRTGENNELIAALYDVVRVDRERCPWLAPRTATATP
jgi:hypothetical protein